jgi:hypothetical protein
MHCCGTFDKHALCVTSHLQAALEASESSFRAAIQFAEPGAIEDDLLEHNKRCQLAFTAAVERIRRVQAEEHLSCAKLLQDAKEAAVAGFNEAEFTIKALECCNEDAIIAAFEVRLLFSMVLGTWAVHSLVSSLYQGRHST